MIACVYAYAVQNSWPNSPIFMKVDMILMPIKSTTQAQLLIPSRQSKNKSYLYA
jgi:hypothetical protein